MFRYWRIIMEEIIDFLKNNIFGKVLYTDELIYTLDDKTLEGVYSDRIIFANPVISEYGFNFDMFVAADEMIYELDKNSERKDIKSNYTGISVFRYEFAKRKSTGEITGIFRLLTTTVKNQTAQGVVCGVFNILLKDNVLSFQEEQVLYRDQRGNGDSYRSVAFDSKNKFYFSVGKLVFEYNGTCYDVNPVSFNKSLSKDVFPKFIARER